MSVSQGLVMAEVGEGDRLEARGEAVAMAVRAAAAVVMARAERAAMS